MLGCRMLVEGGVISSSLSASEFVSYEGLHRCSLLPRTQASPLVSSDNRGAVVAVRAQKRGTQILFRKRKGDDENEESLPEKNRGTQILFRRKPKSESDVSETPKRGTVLLRGTRKISQQAEQDEFSGTPEEVSAAPPGLFSLPKIPFFGLQLFGVGRKVDSKTVFVTGGTGLIGSRVVLELLAAGFNVRSGVEDLGQAQRLAEVAGQYRQLISSEEAKRLNFVRYSTDSPEFTAKAIGNAGKVVVILGPNENGPSKPVNPQDGLAVLKAASLANSSLFVLVSDLAEGSSASQDDLVSRMLSFFGSFTRKGIQYSKLVDEVIDSSLKFTIVRTGFSENVPDSFIGKSNLVVAPEGKLTAGLISKLQIGKLLADILENPDLAEDKIFDVAASETAPSKSFPELLSEVAVDGRRETRKAERAKADLEAREREYRAAAEAEARAVAAEAKAAADTLAAIEAEARQLAAEEAKAAIAAERAQARAEAAAKSVSAVTANLEEISSSSPLPPAKSVIPSFASLVPKPPAIKLSPPALTPPSPAPPKETSKAAPTPPSSPAPPPLGKRRQLRQREKKASPPPTPAPVAVAPPPPAPITKEPKKKAAFAQETFYVDSTDAGDF